MVGGNRNECPRIYRRSLVPQENWTLLPESGCCRFEEWSRYFTRPGGRISAPWSRQGRLRAERRSLLERRPDHEHLRLHKSRWQRHSLWRDEAEHLHGVLERARSCSPPGNRGLGKK